MNRNCIDCKIKEKNGNCPIPAEDRLPIQCVGPWVEDKYYFLNNYLIATKGVRKKFTDKGNAVFIDLFSGPGRGIIRKEKREIDSGDIIAVQSEVPFNDYYLFDIEKVNIDAIRSRTEHITNIHVEVGDSNILVSMLVKKLLKNSYKYHFAFIDPFSADGLQFNTISELAKLQRMDMLIHFPMGSIKRNIPVWINKENTILDKFLGTDSWRSKIKADLSNDEGILLDTFKAQLMAIGYPEAGLKLATVEDIYSSLPVVPVKNTKEVGLYVLILASKDPLAQKIWNSIIKTAPSGQRSFL